jgi:hypothetical protein
VITVDLHNATYPVSVLSVYKEQVLAGHKGTNKLFVTNLSGSNVSVIDLGEHRLDLAVWTPNSSIIYSNVHAALFPKLFTVSLEGNVSLHVEIKIGAYFCNSWFA